MNVTELARILRITPQELRDWMPRLGFDVGQKAIKINKNVANKIIKEWPVLKKRIEREKRIEQEKAKEERVKAQVVTSVTIPRTITVKEFASIAHLQINHVLAELMKNVNSGLKLMVWRLRKRQAITRLLFHRKKTRECMMRSIAEFKAVCGLRRIVCRRKGMEKSLPTSHLQLPTSTTRLWPGSTAMNNTWRVHWPGWPGVSGRTLQRAWFAGIH